MKKLLLFLTVLFFAIVSLNAQFSEYQTTLKKMFEASGTEITFKTSIKQMFSIFKNQYTSVPDSIWTEFEGEFLKTSLDEIVQLISPVYQKYLTQKDLESIIQFYQTPAGKKFAENTPDIMRESMLVGQQWGRKIGEEFQNKMKAKGYK